MGDLTRAQIRQEIVGNLGENRRFSEDDTSTAEYKSITRVLNRAQKAIVRAHPGTWRELRRSDSDLVPVRGEPTTDVYYDNLPQQLHKVLGLVRQDNVTLHTTSASVAGVSTTQIGIVIPSDFHTGLSVGDSVIVVHDDYTEQTVVVTSIVDATPAVASVIHFTGHPLSAQLSAGSPLIHATLNDGTDGDRGVTLRGMIRDQWRHLVGRSDTLSVGKVTDYVQDRDSTGDSRLIWFRVPENHFLLYRYYSVYPINIPDEATASELVNKDDLLIAYATAYCFRRLQLFEEESFWFQSYRTLLQEAIMDDMNQPDEQAVFLGHSAAHSTGVGINSWQDPFRRSSN